LGKILVTSALPYANGDIHIGHLVEYVFTDIYVRFLRLTGQDVIYVCASDAHGAPIEINASKRGVTPQQLVNEFHERHFNDFTRFEVSFDEFYSTDSPENKKHSEIIYLRAKDRNHISERDVEQFYCDSCKRFLPDRYIKGICPKCGASDQYGDVCESCGAIYRPTELSDARCSLCGAPPALRTSKHLFFRLEDFSEFLRDWTSSQGRLQDEVRVFVNTWIDQGLRDWDISRDGPYFGFKIPGEVEKYFYVWLDAPIGYIAATEHFCSGKNDRTVDEYWLDHDSDVEIHHFIGKDIAYFHTLFWPAMLKAADYRLPSAVHVHGFLTIDSRKMSKSRGTFITARKFADNIHPWYLRYYYATKLNDSIDDVDLNIEEFVNRTNAELVNNITNLISRSIGFLNKRLDSRLGRLPDNSGDFQAQALDLMTEVFKDYSNLKISVATRKILSISDMANNYVQQNEPWSSVKSDPEKARDDLTLAINCIKLITIGLKPILPSYCARVEEILETGSLKWEDAKFDLEGKTIGRFDKLIGRLEPGAFQSMVDAASDEPDRSSKIVQNPLTPLKEEITIEDFAKVDLRTGLVVSASVVEGSDKLLKLEVDLGMETRTIFAGIRESYNPEELQGKTLIIVANLKPRKMRFGVSSGMALAAIGTNGKAVVLGPISEVGKGAIVR
jgi:methionyl-tRNA synthetase